MSEKKVIELEVNSNIGTLKQQLKEAKAEVQSLTQEFGATSVETAKAAQHAADLKLEIQEGNKLIKAFDPTKSLVSVNGALGGVQESIGLVGNSIALVGVESETAAAAMEKVGLAMELTSGISSIGESIASFKTLGAVIKSTSIFQGIYNFVQTGSFKATAQATTAKVADTAATVVQGAAVVGTGVAIKGATMATKAFRAALITTGIGAVIVLLMSALDAMGMFTGGTEDAEVAQKNLDDALAKTNETIERQKNLYDGITKSIDQQTKRYEIDAINAGKGEKEIIKIRTEGAQRRIDLYKTENAEAEKLYMKYSKSGSNKQFEAAEKAWKESNNKLQDAQLDFDYAEAERNKKKDKGDSDRHEKNHKAKVKTKKDNNKEEVDLEQQKADRIKELNDNLLAYYDALETNRQSRITSEKEKEEQELANKYDALYLLADKAGKSTKELQEQQGKDSVEITKKYAELDRIAKEEADAKEKEKIAQEKVFLEEITLSEDDLKKQKLENQYKEDQEKYKANADILTALKIKYEADVEKIDAEALVKKRELEKKKIDMGMRALSVINDAIQLGAGKSEKSQRKAFKAQKAFNLATAVVNTYLAVTAALTAGGNPLKLASGTQFIEAGIAAATGALQISKIAATQFDSSSFSKETGGNPADKETTAPTMSAPQFNVVGQSGVNQLATLGQQPIQAYVVSGQVTSQQALDRNRLENATLGG